MKAFAYGALALSAGAIAALLSACGGSQPSNTLPGQRAAAIGQTSQILTTLHVFKGAPDGADPYVAPLIYFEGAFYGTTVEGGEYNAGTVFRVNTDGRERIIHSFGASGDGVEPYGGLIAVNGTMYGTTLAGGLRSNGTLYSITRVGDEHVIYGFQDRDGAEPEGTPVEYKGAFYGTTAYGGEYNYGTVFKISRSGAEKVLYSFGAASQDGRYPSSGVTVLNGAFYGVTIYGGSAAGCGQGCGTVFRVERSGKETIIHNFGGLNYEDGYYPIGGLLALGGTLYGTTIYGGSANHTFGSVFALSKSGKETILLSFGSGVSGAYPYGGLAEVDGVLYGTTEMGGTGNYGTVFKAMVGGGGGAIYSFAHQPGDYPYGTLTNVGGILYGTTSGGGRTNAGTVFSIFPQ